MKCHSNAAGLNVMTLKPWSTTQVDDGWLGVLVGLNWDRVAEKVFETWRWTMMDDKAKMNAKQKQALKKQKKALEDEDDKQKQPSKKQKTAKDKGKQKQPSKEQEKKKAKDKGKQKQPPKKGKKSKGKGGKK